MFVDGIYDVLFGVEPSSFVDVCYLVFVFFVSFFFLYLLQKAQTQDKYRETQIQKQKTEHQRNK